ncbi:serine kinase [candidate division TA06 bacterium DG_24]|uniref:Serine kinase n=3 Tax=Bacteria division TA06 TaxID=1156500 RepID=A0A0S8JL13_UNCT6|nr:MAG: serine kinase [candidate division TA06 bacterium DG_24]KPK70607.1 MAG: serine kinase [candidate division TA06 bacterium SM23_40]KPL10452.1 MAG: serine kinase [candidate division TA06 bacterium SM1_40]
MKLSEIVDRLDLSVRSGKEKLGEDVTGGYASDLLSDVIANSNEGDIWITLQIHQNIVAVASMNKLAGIVLVNGREPEEGTLEAAEQEAMPIMVTDMPTFEVVGKLYELGISGTR